MIYREVLNQQAQSPEYNQMLYRPPSWEQITLCFGKMQSIVILTRKTTWGKEHPAFKHLLVCGKILICSDMLLWFYEWHRKGIYCLGNSLSFIYYLPDKYQNLWKRNFSLKWTRGEAVTSTSYELQLDWLRLSAMGCSRRLEKSHLIRACIAASPEQ